MNLREHLTTDETVWVWPSRFLVLPDWHGHTLNYSPNTGSTSGELGADLTESHV
jgi:hypothetical protein